MIKSYLSLFVLSLLVLFYSSDSAFASKAQAESFLNDVGNQVISVIKDKSLTDKAKEEKLASFFEKHVDFNWVGEFVLGKHKRSASQEQLRRYVKAYKNFIIKSYGSRFKDYAGEKFKVKSSQEIGSGKYNVDTEIIRPAESNVMVSYKVMKKGSQFQIYDIIVEGVSLITTQRSEFNSVINRKGLDVLISALEKKGAS